MYSKSLSKFFLKALIGIAGLGLTTFVPHVDHPAKAALGSVPDCPNEGSAAAAGGPNFEPTPGWSSDGRVFSSEE